MGYFQQASKPGKTDLGREASRFQITGETEQIFNLRLLVEKHLEHQKELFPNFVNFKKGFARVWLAGWPLASLTIIQHRQPVDRCHWVVVVQ